MARMTRRAALAAMPGLVAARAFAQDKPVVAQPGQPVTITVTTSAPPPDVSLALGKREGHVTPARSGCTHTGGGNVDVQQPSPDAVVVAMTGVAVAYGSPAGSAAAALDFTLTQAFEVSFDNPKVKAAKLCLEARVIGFLRSHKAGSAEQCGTAAVSFVGGPAFLVLDVPSHSVSAGQSLGVNDKVGPSCLVVPAGAYCLTQTFRVSAAMPRVVFACKAPSAEFAPDPALDPLWISTKEPFKGALKKDLGFQVTLKVSPADVPANGKK